MSASADLQQLIVARLASSASAIVGDGTATVFTITHNLAAAGLYVSVKAGGVALVSGVDYSVEGLSVNQLRVTALRGAPAISGWTVRAALLRGGGMVDVLGRRPKERASDIEAAAKKHGLCLYVMPPLPKRVEQGAPFVFFNRAEVRVRIVEVVPLNEVGADAYDLLDDICAALHWAAFPTILAHPLSLAETPCEMAEDPSARVIDVIFNAIYGLEPVVA